MDMSPIKQFVGILTEGSIIAFLKLRGILSGSPITFTGQHYLNLFLPLVSFILVKKLNFSNSIYINDKNSLNIIKRFPDLEEINLYNCKNISDDYIKNIDSKIKIEL